MTTKEQTYYMTIVGSEGVGKSNLCFQFVRKCFVEIYDPTIEDVFRTQVTVDEETCFVEVLDCIAERFQYSRFFKEKHDEGFLCVYDVTFRSSFEKLPSSFIEEILHCDTPNEIPIIIIVGNKCDLESQRQVSKEEGEELANRYGYPFIETSAKTGHNVEECFFQLIRKVREFRKQKHENENQKEEKGKSRCSLL
jgi:GTPase KRas protein